MELFDITRNKVLEEMDYAESILSSWGVSYTEKLQDFSSKTLSKKYFCELVRREGSRYNLWIDKENAPEISGNPLKYEVIEDYAGRRHTCEFRHVIWNVLTNNSRRLISFKSNGEISLEKKDKKSDNNSNMKNAYSAHYNVDSSDFEINVITNNVPVSMALNNNGTILTKRVGRFCVDNNLQTEDQIISIDKDDSNTKPYSVKIYTTKNADGREMRALNIYTHKPNGKVVGTYQFACDGSNYFYSFTSHKGNAYTLDCYNKEYFKFQHLLYSVFQDLNIPRPTDKLNYGDDWIPALDSLVDYSVAEVNKCDNAVKGIKGEIPLKGLQERIDSTINQEKEQGMPLVRTPQKNK